MTTTTSNNNNNHRNDDDHNHNLPPLQEPQAMNHPDMLAITTCQTNTAIHPCPQTEQKRGQSGKGRVQASHRLPLSIKTCLPHRTLRMTSVCVPKV